jgi:hypothetical protein
MKQIECSSAVLCSTGHSASVSACSNVCYTLACCITITLVVCSNRARITALHTDNQ